MLAKILHNDTNKEVRVICHQHDCLCFIEIESQVKHPRVSATSGDGEIEVLLKYEDKSIRVMLSHLDIKLLMLNESKYGCCLLIANPGFFERNGAALL